MSSTVPPSLDKLISCLVDAELGCNDCRAARNDHRAVLLHRVQNRQHCNDEFLNALDDLERAHFIGGVESLLL